MSHRLEWHEASLLGHSLDNAVHQSAKVDELTADRADIDNSHGADDGCHERPAEHEDEGRRRGIAQQEKQGESG